jgi:hypothetical protein
MGYQARASAQGLATCRKKTLSGAKFLKTNHRSGNPPAKSGQQKSYT